MALTLLMLENAETDVQVIADVANLPATAPDVINRAGTAIKPLAKVIADIAAAAAFEPPVAYAAGLNITRASQTVSEAGETYAAAPTAIPFVTGALFDPTKWRLIVPQQLVTRGQMKGASPADGDVLLLVDGFKTGPFLFTSANIKTSCDADPNEILFIKPTGGDGSTGAWQRLYDGDVCASWSGFSPTGTAAANAAAGQATIDLVAALGGGWIRWPNGVSQHTGLIFKNKVSHRGGGKDVASLKGTVLLYTGVGDGIQINNPINSSTAANIVIEDMRFKNQNVNAGKACLADTGSTFLDLVRVGFTGSDRGLILDQTEVAKVQACDFEGVVGQTTCLWIVNGADRTGGASAQFSNRITIADCQFNADPATILVADDGGASHAYRDNNTNGGLKHFRIAGVAGLVMDGGEWESAANDNIELCSTSLAGNAVGQCLNVLFTGAPLIVPSVGHAVLHIQSAGSIRFDAGFFGNTASAKVTGAANANCIIALGSVNGGGGANFDGMATNHLSVDSNGVQTNMDWPQLVAVGGQMLFDDVGGATFQSYIEHVVASPFRYHSVVTKGGAGGWVGGYRIQMNYSGGPLFDGFKCEATTDGITSTTTLAGGLRIPEIASGNIPTPPVGFATIFIDTDHQVKSMDHARTLTVL